MDDRNKLLTLLDFIGPIFGTENFGLFLYSLVRLQAPRTIVELGTAFGACAFSMAVGAKHNGIGHIWTVDDCLLFEREKTLVETLQSRRKPEWLGSLSFQDQKQYLREVGRQLGVNKFLTIVEERIDLNEPSHFDRYPFNDKTIDLLFTDFKHSPEDILRILGHFLPRMSPASSIFIDAASTFWPSYLLLEQMVAQLNNGQVPWVLQERCNVELKEVIINRRILLVHLTDARARHQNSRAWLKLEPIDLLPHPRTRMRT
jgi:Methyltransferase domain